MTRQEFVFFIIMIRYVAIVSGLMVGSDWTDQWILQQLIDYLTGQLGGTNVSYTLLYYYYYYY